MALNAGSVPMVLSAEMVALAQLVYYDSSHRMPSDWRFPSISGRPYGPASRTCFEHIA